MLKDEIDAINLKLIELMEHMLEVKKYVTSISEGLQYRSSNGSKMQILVELVADTQTMSHIDGRDAVIEGIRYEVSRNIRRSSMAKADCYAITATCLNYEGGLEELIASIGFFEGNSFAMKRLLAFVANKPIPIAPDLSDPPVT